MFGLKYTDGFTKALPSVAPLAVMTGSIYFLSRSLSGLSFGTAYVIWMGGEVKNSAKSVPIATLASIGIVALVYTGVIVALLAARLPSYGSESVFDASVVYLGPIGGAVIALAALFSTLSSANANVLGASRVILEMASEEQIPGRFARLRNGQPANSILLGTGITAILILAGNLSFIVELTNVTILVAMMLVNISALILTGRKTLISLEKSRFAIPFGPLFPLLGVASCVAMFVTLAPLIIGLGIAILLAGSGLLLIEDAPEREIIIREIRLLLRRPVEQDNEGAT